MDVFYPNVDMDFIVDDLGKYINTYWNDYAHMIAISKTDSDHLEIKIEKLGTSILTFKRIIKDQGSYFSLTNEKIAFTHGPFKLQVRSIIEDWIKKSGGHV